MQFAVQIEQGFERAAAQGRVIESHFAIGDHAVSVRCVGRTLNAQMTRALLHQTCAMDRPPELTIEVYDECESRQDAPLPPWPEPIRSGAPGVPQWPIVYAHAGNLEVTCRYFDGLLNVSVLDQQRSRAWFWSSSSAPSQPTIVDDGAAPFRTILANWFGRRGRQFVHAGAVGVPGVGAALLSGPSGSGKSCSVLACLTPDLPYLGDDRMLVALDPEPRVYSLYATAKLFPADETRFPSLVPFVDRASDGIDKSRLWLGEREPRASLAGIPLRAILLPIVTDAHECSFGPISIAGALRAIAPSTVSQLPGSGRPALRFIASLVHAVPCYELRLGRDVAGLPTLIREVIGHG